MHDLVLVSKSPRRATLLKEAGFKFHTITIEISEILNKNLNLEESLMELASRKARAAIPLVKSIGLHHPILLSGDTVVVLGNEIIGKPKNFDEAFITLTRLTNVTHLVKTSICFIDINLKIEISEVETTEVNFSFPNTNEIKKYILDFKPFDKAGSYGIQEIPKEFIKSIKGDIQNVIGFPIERIKKIIKKKAWRFD